MTSHDETVQTYYDLSARKEYRAAAARVIGDGYSFIDHTTGVVANTPEKLEVALKEDLQWSDQKYVIKESLETTDGAVVVLLTVTRTLTGEWRSVKGEGQRVQREVCEIYGNPPPSLGRLARCYSCRDHAPGLWSSIHSLRWSSPQGVRFNASGERKWRLTKGDWRFARLGWLLVPLIVGSGSLEAPL
jgi:hypothetical protein